jgi:hypothetical protein
MKDRATGMEANVIISKCSTHGGKTFGIRVEKRKRDWVRTWTFKIDEAKAKREGFDRTPIEGTLLPVDECPGCPYCTTMELFICPCGKLSCIKPDSKSIKCFWCGKTHKHLVQLNKARVDGSSF